MNFGNDCASGMGTIRAAPPGWDLPNSMDCTEMHLNELACEKERNRRIGVYQKRVAAGLPIEYDPADFDDVSEPVGQ